MGSSSSTSLHVMTRKEGYSFSSSESTGLSGSAVGGSLPSIFAVMLRMTLDNHTHTSRYKAAGRRIVLPLDGGSFLDTPWLAKKSFICLLPPTCIALISFSVHRIHLHGADETDVDLRGHLGLGETYAQSTMLSGAFEADKRSVRNRCPLWACSAAVSTDLWVRKRR